MIQLVLYFTIYSFLGWVVEIITCLIMQRKLAGRGFLFGPVCPIYGFGALLILWIASFMPNNFCLLFIISMLTCMLLEYIVGYFMEKVFSVKWWDYSTTERFHLHGRVCLRNSLLFGLAGCLLVFYMHPNVIVLVDSISPGWQILAAIVILTLYAFDTIASSYAANQVGKMINIQEIVGDQTTEIKRASRQIYKRMIKTHNNNRRIKKSEKRRTKNRKNS